MKEFIQTKRLYIRPPEATDFKELLHIYRKPRNMEFIPNGGIRWTETRLEEKYEKANEGGQNEFGIRIVTLGKSKKVIGEAGLFNSFNTLKHLELGYLLDEEHWSNGYGTEICQALIQFGFEQLKVSRLTARMFTQNIASVRLAEKCGMKLREEGVTDGGQNFRTYEIARESFIK